MRTLTIEAKAISELAAYTSSNVLNIELVDVNESFIEDIEIDTIISYCDNDKLLDAMDTDELIEYVLNNVEIKNQLATSLGMV